MAISVELKREKEIGRMNCLKPNFVDKCSTNTSRHNNYLTNTKLFSSHDPNVWKFEYMYNICHEICTRFCCVCLCLHHHFLTDQCVTLILILGSLHFVLASTSGAPTRDMGKIDHYLEPLLLIRINCNPNMDKQLRPLYSVGWNYLTILKLQQCNRWRLGMDM